VNAGVRLGDAGLVAPIDAARPVEKRKPKACPNGCHCQVKVENAYQARSKTAICCVSEKIQTAYLRMTARPGFYRFLASHHF
jgi:hypothetical protein